MNILRHGPAALAASLTVLLAACGGGNGRDPLPAASVRESAQALALPGSIRAPARIDTAFGAGGLVQAADLGSSEGAFADVAVQPDGKLLAVGPYTAGRDRVFLVTRTLPDGSLDPRFGDGGRVMLKMGGREESRAVAVLPDGRIVVAGSARRDFAVIRLLPNGRLDPTFGSGGMVLVDMDGDTDTVTALALQPDGRIVVGGTALRSGRGQQFALLRLLADGRPDPAFGVAGKVIAGTGGIARIALRPDGSIFVGGQANQIVAGRSLGTFAVYAFAPDGSPLPGYGQGGLVSRLFFDDVFDSAANYVSDIAVSADGSVTALGATESIVRDAAGNPLDVVRYLVLARLDAGGGFSGFRLHDLRAFFAQPFRFSPNVQPTRLLPAANGRLLAAGRVVGQLVDFSPFDASVLARFQDTLDIDPSFGGGGLRAYPVSAGSQLFTSLGYAAAGDRLVAPGQRTFTTADSVATSNPTLMRLDTSGAPDLLFGSAGLREYDLAGASSGQATLALDSQGRLLLGGSTGLRRVEYGSLHRFGPTGVVDTTLGAKGGFSARDEDPTSLLGLVRGIAALPDGRTAMAYQFSSNVIGSDFCVVVRGADGRLDRSFGGNAGPGAACIDTGPAPQQVRGDVALAVAVQPDGRIVAAGASQAITATAVKASIAVVRVNPDGSRDTSFDGDGVVNISLGSIAPRPEAVGDELIQSIAIAPDGRIVLAGKVFDGTRDVALIVRLNADGSLDGGFAAGGMLRLAIGAGHSAFAAVALQPDGRIVAAGRSFNGQDDDALVVRLLPGGGLDPTFGAAGVVSRGLRAGRDEARALALLPDGRIAVAGSAFNGRDDDFALAVFDVDGSLPAGALLLTPIGQGDDVLDALTVMPDGRLVAAGRVTQFGITRAVLIGYRP